MDICLILMLRVLLNTTAESGDPMADFVSLLGLLVMAVGAVSSLF